MCLVFTPKTFADYGGENYYGGGLYSEEQAGTIDVVAIGNSDLYNSLIPSKLYGEYGFTTYNCGSSRQNLKLGYSFLKDINDNHDVKLLIIEADFIYENRKNFDIKKHFGKARWLLSPFVYHAKWKQLKAKDFYEFPKPNQDAFKGYRFSTKVGKFKVKNYMVEKPKTKIPPKNLKMFEKIVKFCQNNKIDIICYEAPSQSSWNLTKSNQVHDLCSKHNIPFYDFNLMFEEIDFNPKTDYRDNGNHLNIDGSQKITAYLGDVISEKYSLPNHHGDDRYKNWDNSYKLYLNKLKNTQNG